MTKDRAVARVLEIARAEIGYHEKNSAAGLDDKTANAGGGNWTKYARDLDAIPGFYNGAKNGFAWCDVFVDWLFVTAFGPDTGREMICQPLMSAGAGCLYSAQYYKAAGRWFTTPQAGDQIFFSYAAGEYSHTGIVTRVAGGAVYTVEGNTSDMVAEKVYSLSSSFIAGYGRPRWELAAGIEAGENEATGSGEGAGDPAGDGGEASGPGTEPEPRRTFTVTLPELRKGDTGVAVERLQTLLIGRGYWCGGRVYGGREHPDGEFGPATEVAVLDLQQAGGITKDGIVGAETVRALLTT